MLRPSRRGGTPAILVPTAAQRGASRARWRRRCAALRARGAVVDTFVLPEASRRPGVAVSRALEAASRARPHDAVVLDFVGHSPRVATAVRRRLHGRVVIDVGEAGVHELASQVAGEVGG